MSLPILRHTLLRPSLPLRAFSTSPTRFIRPGSGGPSPPASSFQKSTQKQVAPKPSSVPLGTTVPKGGVFEPVVNDLKDPFGPTPIPTPPTEPTPPVEEADSQTFDRSSLPSLDIDPLLSLPITASSSSTSSSGRTGARARSEKPQSSIDKKWRSMEKLLLLGALVGLGAGAYELGKDDGTKLDGVDETTNPVMAHWLRAKKKFGESLDYLNKPAFPSLLPDSLPPPHQRPYTLLVDLEGLLVHSSWDRATGWRTAKRPGVDYFLAYLSQFYEIVLFTSQPLYTAMPIAEKLDPFGAYIPYKLYRESTRYVKGKIVKDLTYLNRPLSHTILLDTVADHASAQPENAIILKPWNGERGPGGERGEGEGGLVEMIPFLESIAIFNTPDVRPILKAYEGKNIPLEYAKLEAMQKAAAVKEWEREHGTVGTAGAAGAGVGWLGRAFSGLGGVSDFAPVFNVFNTTVPRQTQPMTYLESKRALAQKGYQEEQEYWAKNADEIKRLMEEDRQKQMAEQKGSLIGWFAGAGKAEEPQAAK